MRWFPVPEFLLRTLLVPAKDAYKLTMLPLENGTGWIADLLQPLPVSVAFSPVARRPSIFRGRSVA
jgi:hypothetical protein